MFQLNKKIALITGAGSGIGASIAQVFAQAGAMVLVTDKDEKSGKLTAAGILDSNGKAEFYPLDVAIEDECNQLARKLEQTFFRVDILVNNAGIGHVGTMMETSGEDFDRLYRVNVRGVFNVTKAFLPGMLQRKSGNIINLASIGGVVGIRDRLAYSTSKFAVVGMTKCMALDHAREGLRVNCICPGRVETPFVSARLKEYPDPEKAYQEMASTQALGRMGKPEEIAWAALYLASDESSFITGAAFMIDGGWSAGK
jgi:2-keto-3-deoxy-L-fuconate dehydrogenase